MTNPNDTWALVVGIDEYDHPDQLRPLTGAVADAAAAVAWLRGLGVPGEQIRLHVSPSPQSLPAVEALDVAVTGDATFAAITRTLGEFHRHPGGDRLVVLLAGHAVFEPTAGRLFLCQDFADIEGDPAQTASLAIDGLVKRLLATKFREQFCFVDGCQNLPYSPAVRQRLESALPLVAITPDESNSLVCAFGASQGELAKETSAGRGAFLGTLLPVLEPARYLVPSVAPGLDTAVRLDFETGDRLVFLEDLVRWAREEIGASGGSQTPYVEYHGRARAEVPALLRLPADDTSEIVLEVRPGDSGVHVEQITLTCDEPPVRRARRQVGGQPIAFPDVFRVPLGLSARIHCRVTDTSPPLREGFLTLTATAPNYSFAFEFDEPLSPVGPPSASLEPGDAMAVGLHWADGSGAYEMTGDLYDTLQGEIGPFPGVDDDIAFEHHESGPVFRTASPDPGTRARLRQLAKGWTEGIASNLAERGVVASTLSGANEGSATIRIGFPAGSAAGLAGSLSGTLLLAISPPGADEGELRRYSLDEVEANTVSVDPGLSQVVLELPWGTWSRTVNVGPGEEAVLELPASVGVTPLRVSYAPWSDVNERLIFVHERKGRRRPTGTGFDAYTTKRAREKAGLPEVGVPILRAEPGAELVTIDVEGRGMSFPAFKDRNFAVSLDPAHLRVEPLSAVASPEWDLVVAAGRLDALSDQQAVELTNAKWFDELLGLAGAYALYARSNPDTTIVPEYLGIVLDNLRNSVGHSSLDWDLLDIFRQNSPSGPLSVEASQRLSVIAASRPLPLFRWGVPLALSLLHRSRGRANEDWLAHLQRVDRGTVPGAAWMTYFEEA